MSDHSSERTTRSYTRKEVLRGAAGTGAALGLAPILAACGGSSSGGSSAGGSSGGAGPITIGSFSDPAMVPFRDVFLKKYKQETGNVAHYNETNYDAWYQNSKNDGLQKTGAYDIYVMDDNWVPEFAASGIVQSLDKLGLKVNPDILQKGLEQGYWPPKSGPRLKAFASDTPQLYSLVIIDDVEMLYYNSDYFKSAPQTYRDWAGNQEWDIETTGKEDEMFSPFLRKPFKRAVAEGLIPQNLITLAGTWGTISDTGDLTYLNLIHLTGVDGTSADDLTRGEIEGRKQAMYAIDALRAFMPGCEDAVLRNFGMTIGIRDTRKIEALYDMTGEDVREQGRFEDSIGIFPEFIDGYGVLILPTTGRYFQVPYRSLVPKGIGNLIVAGRSIGGDKISHASVRNMMCCTVSGQGAGVAAAVSVRDDTPFHALDVRKIQTELKRQGVRLD